MEYQSKGFLGSSSGKEFTCNVGDLGSIPGSGRSPRGQNGNPLHYSCLENPMDRGAWRATVFGVAKSWTRLSDKHFHFHQSKGIFWDTGSSYWPETKSKRVLLTSYL